MVRLGDVARIEMAPEETRRLFRGNGVEQVGLGIVRQSHSNALDVARRVKAEVERIRPALPEGTDIALNYDSTLFIDRAIGRVGQTLLESTLLVILVIYLFLGSWHAALVPAAVIPVCLIGAFAVLSLFGFSINLLTLLALVLAIGLVVHDSIVVLENAQRRVDSLGEPPLIASERKDYAAAGQLFELASKLPDAWYIAARWAAASVAKAGDYETAKQMWLDMYNGTENKALKALAVRQLRNLKLTKGLDDLQKAVDRFREDRGVLPSGLQELVSSGYIDRVPEEPYGGRFLLDGDKVKTTTPASERD